MKDEMIWDYWHALRARRVHTDVDVEIIFDFLFRH